MSYTNTTMDRLPLVYPLSMAVKWVDDTIDFRSTGYRVSPEAGASERRNQTKSCMGPKYMYKSVVGGLKMKNQTPKRDTLHIRHLYSAGEGSTLITQNSHSRQTGGNLVITWDKTVLHMFPRPTLTQPRKQCHLSTPSRCQSNV